MKSKRYVVSILVLIVLFLFGCTESVSQLSKTPATENTTPGSATPIITPLVGSIILEFADTDELEEFLKRLKADKSLDPFGNISSEKYFKLEKILPNPSSMRIYINLSLLIFYYYYPDMPAEYNQNVVSFTWDRSFTDGEAFLREWSKVQPTEEVKYKGTRFLYVKAKAPAGKNGEEIDVYQGAAWAQGNDCFTSTFPLSVSKEEFLDFCRAVSKKIE